MGIEECLYLACVASYRINTTRFQGWRSMVTRDWIEENAACSYSFELYTAYKAQALGNGFMRCHLSACVLHAYSRVSWAGI